MRIFRGVPTQATTASVLTIGNFDGVHRGHRALLDRLTAKARALSLPATVLTFEPHPRQLFAPDQAPARLGSLREKLELLAECGVERVHIVRFTRALAALSAEQFIQRILRQGLDIRHLIIGDDFRFGQGRRGDFALLQRAGTGRHDGIDGIPFTVEAMPTVDYQGLRVSSSAVRTALAQGDIELAGELLGRAYVIDGRVVHGDKVGRTLGFPTANIRIKRARLPLSGVFAVTVSGIAPQPIPGGATKPLPGVATKPLPGVANIGVRPTLADGLKPVLEVHLLDFDRDIYGTHVTINFLHKIRDEKKFASLDALKAQIADDIAATRASFAGKT